MISVVIPAYNAAATLDPQLAALAPQCADIDVEVIVADNGSTDATRSIAERWADRMPVRVVDASARRGASAARNIGVGAARGDFLAFTDADDVVSDRWLRAYDALDDRVELAGGPVVYFRASEPAPRWATGVADEPPVQLGFLPYAVGTNIAMSRAAFERVGGFPEDWPPAEDVVICWRLQLDGIPLHYATDAIVWKRRRATMRGTMREYYWYGRRDPELMREFDVKRAHRQPPLETTHVYLGLVARLPLLFSETQRERWSAQAGRRYGRIVGSFKTRTFCP